MSAAADPPVQGLPVTPEGRLEWCEACKVRGNELFRAGESRLAVIEYKKCLGFFRDSRMPTDLFGGGGGGSVPPSQQKQPSPADVEGPLQERWKQVMMDVYNNIAACYTRLRKWDYVVTYGKKSLEVAPNAKAFVRLSEAAIEHGAWGEARENLLALAAMDPSHAALSKLPAVEENLRQREMQQAARLRNMFDAGDEGDQ
eukprot:EC799031.1.p1 GENE.EC799031.1~~EC799031.1.p1  ORF type:complete len:200 (+),score=41.56 EC799031.1:90-689(+)